MRQLIILETKQVTSPHFSTQRLAKGLQNHQQHFDSPSFIIIHGFPIFLGLQPLMVPLNCCNDYLGHYHRWQGVGFLFIYLFLHIITPFVNETLQLFIFDKFLYKTFRGSTFIDLLFSIIIIVTIFMRLCFIALVNKGINWQNVLGIFTSQRLHLV